MAELVDALVLDSSNFGCESSSLSTRIYIGTMICFIFKLNYFF
jgi:hypothetical protein